LAAKAGEAAVSVEAPLEAMVEVAGPLAEEAQGSAVALRGAAVGAAQAALEAVVLLPVH
jgi:hypothetical protein